MKTHTKKLLSALILFFTLSASPNTFAGIYDGVWTSPSLLGQYYMLRENGGQLLLVQLGTDWEAYMGQISGTTGVLTTLISDVQLTMTISFSSPVSASVLINSCSPIASCDFSAGDTLTVSKIF